MSIVILIFIFNLHKVVRHRFGRGGRRVKRLYHHHEVSKQKVIPHIADIAIRAIYPKHNICRGYLIARRVSANRTESDITKEQHRHYKHRKRGKEDYCSSKPSEKSLHQNVLRRLKMMILLAVPTPS